MKLLVMDYDGTLFVNDNDLKNNINYLKKWKNNNNLIMISTGRSYPSIKNQVDINNIIYDYISCADGSLIYDTDGNILEMYKMDNDIIEPYEKFYKDLKYEEIQFSYPRGYSNILLDDKNLLGINICLSNENYTKEIVNSFLLLSEKYPKYHFLNYMHPNFSYLCVKPSGIDKSKTIDYLKEKLKLKNNDIYVIGDSYNDLEMIKKYNGVCMDNSYDEILKISKKSYSTVAKYIEDILN